MQKILICKCVKQIHFNPIYCIITMNITIQANKQNEGSSGFSDTVYTTQLKCVFASAFLRTGNHCHCHCKRP